MRLRTLSIGLAVVGVPLLVYLAERSAQVPEVTFARAVEMAAERSSEEKAPTVMLRVRVHALPSAGTASPTLWAQDAEGRVFAVEYTGGEALPVLQPGQPLMLIGHAHGGERPYFHALQIRQQ
jgi:hypothetical protein